jgi:hypothetical protein
VVVAREGAGLPLDPGASALFGPARRAVQALVPPDRFVVMDGGHCLHRDHPDAWSENVSTFADGLWTPVDT